MTIKNVTIIGAGTMGSGIAIALAQKGCGVQIVDISMDAIDRALDRAQVFYARQVEKGRMDEQLADTAHALLSGSTDFEIAANADLVIEAVFEDLDLKRETFDKLNDIVREDAFLATNTSCLKVGDIAEAVDNPGRFLGLHYFSPAEISPLVEIVKGEETDTATIEAMKAFCLDTGKQPLLCRDQNGFAVNRFFCPYTNEAVLLHEEGLGHDRSNRPRCQRSCGCRWRPFLGDEPR
jgi:3-hydroxybutyryl-CoA dehydrogenase